MVGEDEEAKGESGAQGLVLDWALGPREQSSHTEARDGKEDQVGLLKKSLGDVEVEGAVNGKVREGKEHPHVGEQTGQEQPQPKLIFYRTPIQT